MGQLSSVVAGWLQVCDPVSLDGEECLVCGFDSLLTFPVVLLTRSGVLPWQPIKVCGQCADQVDTA